MSKSAIYTAQTTPVAVTVGDLMPLGATIRRFGCAIVQDGNTITIKGNGYFKVTASATVAPVAVGTVSMTLNKDGVAVTGATASSSVTTAANPTDLAITAIVRNPCDCDSSVLSFVLGVSASTLSNLAVTVEKL